MCTGKRMARRVYTRDSRFRGLTAVGTQSAKLMRRAQIVPKAVRRFRVTTDSRNTEDVFPKLVRRCFKAERPKCLPAST
jgi:hypothetical protein